MFLLALLFVLVASSEGEDVWIINYFAPNSECKGNSPFILRTTSNTTCQGTGGQCIKTQTGFATIQCEKPYLGNYAWVKKFRDDKPGDCAIYWSDGYILLDTCTNMTSFGIGYSMNHCEGKNLVTTLYDTEYCIKPAKVFSHYIQNTCVVDGLHDNDMFMKFGRCGV